MRRSQYSTSLTIRAGTTSGGATGFVPMSGNVFGRGMIAGAGAEDRLASPSLTSHLSNAVCGRQGYEMPRYVNSRERRFPTSRLP
jgi:hypothetical protein